MGAECTPCISNRKDIKRINTEHSNFPEDLHAYESQSKHNLPKIKFNGLLYNIRIINWARVRHLVYLRVQFH